MWAKIVDLVFGCFAWFQSLVGDWGLAIIIVTVIFRLIITPITHKQNKSSYMMRKLNPLVKQIQATYGDDKQKASIETQKLYKEAGYNPLLGCLPMLIQMPIFIALFQALRSLSTRVGEGTVTSFFSILPDLSITPIEAFKQLGLGSSIPYFLMVLIFGASIIVPSLISGQMSEKSQKYMMVFMAAMMMYIGCVSPAGVLIFWDTSSIWQVCVQIISFKIYEKRDEEKEEIQIPKKEIEVTRKEKKPRPTKKH